MAQLTPLYIIMYPAYRAPETMTASDQAGRLQATVPAPRDHVLFSMALGIALRPSELLDLDVGDVGPDGHEVRERVTLDPAMTKSGRKGEVFLPARLIPKLWAFLAWKSEAGESVEPDAPVFVSAQRWRLSPRAAQWRFTWWLRRAGFDRVYNFHSLRHSAVTNVYRATRDLFLAQRFARHPSPRATVVYTCAADRDLYVDSETSFLTITAKKARPKWISPNSGTRLPPRSALS